MNITETAPPEKAKRKAKPRIDRYSQNEAFFVIVVSLAVMMFFWLPYKVNAVAAMPLLGPAAIGVSIVITVVSFILLRRLANLNLGLSCFLSIMSVPIILGAAGYGVLLLAQVSIFRVFVILFILFFILAKLSGWHEILNKLNFPIKVMSLILLTCAVCTALYLGYSSTSLKPIDHISIDDTNYYLVLDRGVLDPDQVQLYECNHLSIYCEIIYNTNPSEDYSHNTAEMHQGDQDNILVLIDGEVVYDSSEGAQR